MTSASLHRSSLVGLAVDELIRLIIDRALREGDPLPSTADLAETMDVSRTVVREAIAELAGQGLLIRRQGRETLVAVPDAGRLEHLLRLRFAVNGTDFAGLQEFRQILEVGSARLAAQRPSRNDVTSLAAALIALQGAAPGEDLHLLDQAFHRELARVSGNEFVLLTLDGITPLLVDLRRRAWAGWVDSGRGLSDIIDAHTRIFECVERNDPEGAEEAMRAHLRQAGIGLAHEATRPTVGPDSMRQE